MLESAFPSPINARPSISAELASHATKDTTLLEENASWPLSKKFLTLDVELGIGKTRDVWPVPSDMSSMLSENAFPSTTTAKNGVQLDLVLLAMPDTFLTKEFVLKETLSASHQTHQEPALLAILVISLITEIVCLFQSWQTLLFIILNAAPKSWQLFQILLELQLVKVSDHDVFAGFI